MAPDNETNGLALCSLHHKMLDSGVFSLNESFKVQISPKANGPSIDDFLLPYENKTIRIPRVKEYRPNEVFINWHVKEVYTGGYHHK